MNIVSLNTWRGTQYEELRDFLAVHTPSVDVFCFQETDGNVIEQIFQEAFPDKLFQRVNTTKYFNGAPDSITTFVRRNMTVVASSPLLADTGDDVGHAYHTHLRYNGSDVHIVNVHGAPYPGDKLDTSGRILQSQVIIDTLAAQAGAKVICGDFNLEPTTESVAMLERAGYKNLISEYSIVTTRNELAWAKWPDNKQPFADYAFVSPDVSVRHFAVPDCLISDHLPLHIEITTD